MSISCTWILILKEIWQGELKWMSWIPKMERVETLMKLSHKLGKLSSQLEAGRCAKTVKVSKDGYDYQLHNFLLQKRDKPWHQGNRYLVGFDFGWCLYSTLHLQQLLEILQSPKKLLALCDTTVAIKMFWQSCQLPSWCWGHPEGSCLSVAASKFPDIVY